MQFLDAPKLGRITTTSQKGGIMQKAFDQKKIKIAWWNHVTEDYTSGGKEVLWNTDAYSKETG